MGAFDNNMHEYFLVDLHFLEPEKGPFLIFILETHERYYRPPKWQKLSDKCHKNQGPDHFNQKYLMPRSQIHGSPRRFYYGLNLTDDPRNANFRSPIRMYYIRMIKYYYVWLRIQYVKLWTNTVCDECTSVANPASSPWMCDLGIKENKTSLQPR